MDVGEEGEGAEKEGRADEVAQRGQIRNGGVVRIHAPIPQHGHHPLTDEEEDGHLKSVSRLRCPVTVFVLLFVRRHTPGGQLAPLCPTALQQRFYGLTKL